MTEREPPTREEISKILRDKRSQKFITLEGQRFVADKQMIPLLRVLNSVGLRTVSHCGHTSHKFVRLSMDNIRSVEMATVDGERSLVIQWTKTDCRLCL